MANRSKTVAEKVAELYALMATVAAKRAISSLEQYSSENATRDADFWASTAGRWMDKSSARAVSWTYSRPKV